MHASNATGNNAEVMCSGEHGKSSPSREPARGMEASDEATGPVFFAHVERCRHWQSCRRKPPSSANADSPDPHTLHPDPPGGVREFLEDAWWAMKAGDWEYSENPGRVPHTPKRPSVVKALTAAALAAIAALGLLFWRMLCNS